MKKSKLNIHYREAIEANPFFELQQRKGTKKTTHNGNRLKTGK